MHKAPTERRINTDYLNAYLLSHEKTISTLAQRLKFARKFRGLTQREVAKSLKVSYQQYQKYEYGLYIPTRNMRRKLAKALNIDICLINVGAITTT